MKLLALDLGTKTGWALKTEKPKPKYGTLDLAKNHHFDGCGVQYLQFAKWLHDQLPLDLIVFEQVMAHHPGAVHAQHKYGGLLATVQTFGDQFGVMYTGLGVTTIKKFWLGRGTKTKKGAAGKKEMIAECRNRGFNPKTDDEADAIAILHLGLDMYELLL